MFFFCLVHTSENLKCANYVVVGRNWNMFLVKLKMFEYAGKAECGMR